MKKCFNICRSIFAVIGVIATLLVILYFIRKPYFEVDVYPSRVAMMDEYVDSLRASGPYGKDTSDFRIRIIQDSVRAKEIQVYFRLDTLYAPDADTWTKALAIGKFVASNVPHDNQKEWPESVNAIGLWDYTKQVAPAFNCRLHSILAFELFLAAGLDAKFITCMPEDSNDNDCHVVNEVWLPEMGKWAMIDTDMGGHYFSDLGGIPLSLKEMRDRYISGEKMMVYPEFRDGRTKKDWYYAYMAKNTYWFSCWGELSYYQEDYDHEDVIRAHYIHLVPSGFHPFRTGEGSSVTTDADRFWAAPN
ncbi:MAG: transglutaminase domain-containing protein [Bacteroidales bacterium]|nr:transglutaminase domain-containing protein [Bacteroidales bacterium]